MSAGIGDEFQKETKYYRGKLMGGYLDWSKKPRIYKEYPHSRKIRLPFPKPTKNMSLDMVLKKRRSIRKFSMKPINNEQLSYLLWASTGLQRKEGGYEFRTIPSAGALYPIETYLATFNVEGLEKALYHYSIKSHFLEELQIGDFSKLITQAALGQEMCLLAATVFIWTAIFKRSKWKYKQRGYRYVYIDSGHIAQNLALSATSIGLGSCQVGAFFDDEINRIIGVDGIEESAVYLCVVGHPQHEISNI